MGFGGTGSHTLPWHQYNHGPYTEPNDLCKVMPSLMDWFQGERGIVFTIFDLHRLEPFRFPEMYGGMWNNFLQAQNFELWAYLPVDGHSPNGGLVASSSEILRACDRVLAYGPYGQGVLRKALPNGHKLSPADIDQIPHGINMDVFRDLGKEGRSNLAREIPSDLDPSGKRVVSVGPDDKLLGVIGTNQPRKDWGSTFKIFKALVTKDPTWKLWAHTDKLQKAWSIPDLAQQFDVEPNQVYVTFSMDDDSLATMYSSCDVTFGNGAEGFGLPLVEAMSCNTPTVHTRFAGGADLLPPESLVEPMGTRLEGFLCLERPIIDITATADRIIELQKLGRWGRNQVMGYNWSTVWPKFRTWFAQGIHKIRENGEA